MAVAFISVVLHGTRVTCKLHKITAEIQLPARKAHTELEGRMKKYFFTLYLSMNVIPFVLIFGMRKPNMIFRFVQLYFSSL